MLLNKSDAHNLFVFMFHAQAVQNNRQAFTVQWLKVGESVVCGHLNLYLHLSIDFVCNLSTLSVCTKHEQ